MPGWGRFHFAAPQLTGSVGHFARDAWPHDRLPAQAPRDRHRDPGRRLDRRLRRAGSPARRSGPADARHERQRGRRSMSLREQLGLNLPRPAALSRLDRRAARRSISADPTPIRFRSSTSSASAPPSRCRWRSWRSSCRSPSRCRSAPSRPAGAGGPPTRSSMGAAQIGVADPEFLVRADADLRLRRLAALGAGRRLSRLERGHLAGRQGAHPAGHRARAAAGGDPGARHALGAGRRARRGLHPHRPRQGPAGANGPVAPRAAQRADPGADHPRPAVLLPARRHHHHRERLLPARPRPAGLPGDHPARPDRGRKRRHAAGGRRHRRQPAGRPLLRAGRSAAEGVA